MTIFTINLALMTTFLVDHQDDRRNAWAFPGPFRQNGPTTPTTADNNPQFNGINNDDSFCQSGALMTETVVPGAYENPCMNLPFRNIPLLASSSDNENSRKSLRIEQRGVGAGSTGLAVWNSSLLLGRLLQQIPQTWIHSKNVVELGCGTGLVSLIALLSCGAQSVWATDGNPQAVALAQDNIDANCKDADLNNHNMIQAQQLAWGMLDVPDSLTDAADIVLGSDLTYNSGSWRVLAETMAAIVKPSTGIVIYLSLGHSGFDVRGEMDGFLQVAKQQGLSILPSESLYLQSLLRRPNLVSTREQSILATTGGVQVVAMGKK